MRPGTRALNPGARCGLIQVKGSASLVLSPGERCCLDSSFDLRGAASTSGTDVVLVFSGTTALQFKGDAFLSFDGRQSGPYADLFIVTGRSNQGADESPWTVAVAKSCPS